MGVGNRSSTPFATYHGGCATAVGTDYAVPFTATATAATKISGSNPANQQGIMAQACTITSLWAVAPVAYAIAAGQAVTLMKNGAATALTVTTAVVGTVVSASGSVSFAAGDVWSIKIVEGVGANFVIWGLGVQ